jgi:hypothetical protein
VLACFSGIIWHNRLTQLVLYATVLHLSLHRAVHALLGLATWLFQSLVKGPARWLHYAIRWRLPAQVNSCSWQPGLLGCLTDLVCIYVCVPCATLNHVQPPEGFKWFHMFNPIQFIMTPLSHRQGNQGMLGMPRDKFACTPAETCLGSHESTLKSLLFG